MRVKARLVTIFLGWVSGCGLGAQGALPPGKVTAAIQAVQQAPDPSAAISAYGDAVALDRKNPAIHAAYLNRMIDFGLPELAFHQAETLTTLQADNGLAWGVLAFMDARKGQLYEAVSAISLAGQFAPDDKFVERTAGEILAWYDMRADKAQVPKNDQDGISKVRELLKKRDPFMQAYEAAKRAYQGQENPRPAPTPKAPPQAGTNQPAKAD